jgi:unsaturated chondroitin disaccharide hydrolase
MKIDKNLQAGDLLPKIERVFDLAAAKVRSIDQQSDSIDGAPVITVEGKYTSRSWTEWTEGFAYGCPLLVFDGTDDASMLELGRKQTVERMAGHVTHFGVHDHGFNTISTYGNLWRLMREGRIGHNLWEQAFYELAIKSSGAVQAARWSGQADANPAPGAGAQYIYSFNGPQSLFIDTIRTLRVLDLAHQLGQDLAGESDRHYSLLERSIAHAMSSIKYLVFDGQSEHTYDVAGRTAHEALFNPNDMAFRCRSTQQGYSPFSTWTRGLAWAMLGFVEQLEFISSLSVEDLAGQHGLDRAAIIAAYQATAEATCKHYINDVTASDGIPYWDDGAPGLARLGSWQTEPANPFNDFEPVDSSAAAIAAQGLIRLGHYLGTDDVAGAKYTSAGLTIAAALFDEPYLSTDADHQGLLLHSVYHRPNGWDHIPARRKVPCGESSMWGDYHALELAVLIQRLAPNGHKPYPVFFDQA